MDAHQVVCCGYQFKDGVRLMVLSTPSLIANMARAIECGWQTVGHWDGAFNRCNKDFGLLAFGLNRMGAHYNPDVGRTLKSRNFTTTDIKSVLRAHDIMDSHVRRVQLIVLFISAMCPLIYACLQNHAKFCQAWRLELLVHVSRYSAIYSKRCKGF